MKKGFVLLATIVAVILIGNVVIAYAQNGVTPGYPPMGPGMMGGQMYDTMMGANGLHEAVMTAVAKKLGMTYAELTTALQTQTIAQLAEAKGVALADLQKVADDARNAELDKLVAQGTLTQQQTDWMKSRMQAMPLTNLDNCPMQNGQSGAYGPGMMGRGQNNGQSGTYGPGMMGGRGVHGGMMGGRGYAQPTGPQG